MLRRARLAVFFISILFFFILPSLCAAQSYYEISGSPFDTHDAPLPQQLKHNTEKLILVDPNAHAYGAYNARGKLIRWGIATAGAYDCADSTSSCRTKTGRFRIYSLGNSECVSHKYDGAPMPYCMFFNGNMALHGSNNVQFENISHGCVRVHVDDAKWLRYHFVEGPSAANLYRGTLVVVKGY